MLIYIVGPKGSGKTLLQIYYALYSYIYHKKRKIVGNLSIKLPNFKIITPVDLMKLGDNCLILLDEIYSWLEARGSGTSNINTMISHIFTHSRKTFVNYIGTAVLYRMADIRFREEAEILIETQIRKDKNYDDFIYTYNYKEYGISETLILPYEDAIKMFKYYDTYEIIKSIKQDKLEFSLISQNPKQLLIKIKEIAKKFDIPHSITHDSLKMFLMENEIYLGYEKYLYVYLKQSFNKKINE